ncbi:hypothetical protein Tco_0027091 [Tanacetum coccineum]
MEYTKASTSTTKMEYADKKEHTLIEQHVYQACHDTFYLTLIGLQASLVLAYQRIKLNLQATALNFQYCIPFFHKHIASKSDIQRSPRDEEQVFLDDLARLQRQEKAANEEAEALLKILNKEPKNTWLPGRSC